MPTGKITNYLFTITAMIAFTMLSSCGFTPVYKTENNSYRFLQKIEILPINSLEGSEFFNQLKNIFPPSGSYDYTLATSLSFSKNFSVIQINSDILREAVTLHVIYTLREKNSDKIIVSGSFSRLSSYNTTFSPYNNEMIEQNIQKNMAIIAAEEVRNRLLLYITHRK
jgi:hypothetical protein